MSGTAVVAFARNPIEAGIWVDALRQAGILAETFESGPGAALGGASVFTARFPVIVSADDIGRARSIITDLAGAEVLEPVRDSGSRRSPWRAAFSPSGWRSLFRRPQ